MNPKISNHAFAEESIRHLETNGYFGPLPVLGPTLCRALIDHFERGDKPNPAEWWKGHAVTDPFVFDIAVDKQILNAVKAMLGPNVVLWGTQFIRRSPGQVHAWHSDIEAEIFPTKFLSVWIGLSNTTPHSGLRFVDRSHQFGKSIQQVAAEHGISRSSLPDSDLLDLANEFSKDAAIGRPSATDGDAVFFAGGVWHASFNSTHEERLALLLQYATPDVPVMIPDWKQLDWPYKVTDVRAPCVLVAGLAANSPQDLRSAPS